MMATFWRFVWTVSCLLHVGTAVHVCSLHCRRQVQTVWQDIMVSLDTASKRLLVEEVVYDLQAVSPRAADVISGRAATNPRITHAGARYAYLENLRQMSTLLQLLGNDEALDRQIRHYVQSNHIRGEEAASVARGLQELFRVFLSVADLDDSVWWTCVLDITNRLQTEAGREDPTLYAECHIDSSTGDQAQAIHGTITLEQAGSGGSTIIKGEIHGFSVGDDHIQHGFHVHQEGDLGNNCKDAGGHYNPDGLSHGGPYNTNRHVGDLGNISEDEKGIARVHKWDNKVSLSGEQSVLNRAIVVHAHTDDLGQGGHADSLLTGHAGPRLGCCVIRQVTNLSATT